MSYYTHPFFITLMMLGRLFISNEKGTDFLRESLSQFHQAIGDQEVKQVTTCQIITTPENLNQKAIQKHGNTKKMKKYISLQLTMVCFLNKIGRASCRERV